MRTLLIFVRRILCIPILWLVFACLANAQSGGGWQVVDVNGGTLTVAVGTRLTLMAHKNPPDAPAWPHGDPRWTVLKPGATDPEDFGAAGNPRADYGPLNTAGKYVFSAHCGGSSLSVVVYALKAEFVDRDGDPMKFLGTVSASLVRALLDDSYSIGDLPSHSFFYFRIRGIVPSQIQQAELRSLSVDDGFLDALVAINGTDAITEHAALLYTGDYVFTDAEKTAFFNKFAIRLLHNQGAKGGTEGKPLEKIEGTIFRLRWKAGEQFSKDNGLVGTVLDRRLTLGPLPEPVILENPDGSFDAGLGYLVEMVGDLTSQKIELPQGNVKFYQKAKLTVQKNNEEPVFQTRDPDEVPVDLNPYKDAAKTQVKNVYAIDKPGISISHPGSVADPKDTVLKVQTDFDSMFSISSADGQKNYLIGAKAWRMKMEWKKTGKAYRANGTPMRRQNIDAVQFAGVNWTRSGPGQPGDWDNYTLLVVNDSNGKDKGKTFRVRATAENFVVIEGNFADPTTPKTFAIYNNQTWTLQNVTVEEKEPEK